MTIYYRPYQPPRRLRIRRISDRTFWTGIAFIGGFSIFALNSAYQFFVG